MGIVDACGSGFLARRLQDRRVAISAPPPQGTWQQYVVVDVKRAVAVPDDLSNEQAAMFFINPLSSWLLINQALKVRCLTLGGHMVLFGTLANQSVSLPSRDLMMPLVQLSGFFAGA